MIRKATAIDIDSILEITKACAAHMIRKNIYQWNTHYPNRQAFLKDFQNGELYVLDIENKVKACVTISTFMDDEYIPISWLTASKKNIYIHRLAVHPENQGQGYAQKLMTFSEDYARTDNYQSVRLDTFSKNLRNQKFYERRGYKKIGSIYFPKQSEYPFYCYELVL